ncbi:hypothetical protein BGP77_02800 [Saccharospirillum sp. MSK14-1]|uniref:endonuclease/exonuclease/phosphatase family protein n=1 Tax=Saccharospirillum sp. MSK14-1 TaxID=1897632 RepID=UPI000D36D49B|nr:endonuclease/exonuclease/phosphatase family protein [Saccharospirillum sp. MSK14-1]PTY36256.1 hypothetical protein BGP77_02800 [Saccharospirillum sp. MSK14-1]
MRLASYNVALNRASESALNTELKGAGSTQLRAVIEVMQSLQADVLVLNEIDRDADATNLDLFADRWLLPAGLDYPHRYFAPVNTGVDSGRDLVKDDQQKTTPFGFGAFPGQYAMAVLSRWPIDLSASRTFQHFLWRDLPGADFPKQPDGSDFYHPDDLGVLRLSSKSHWDVLIQAPDGDFHLLVSHPTPPAFDGPERRNAHRNNDEIRFWLNYLNATETSPTISDDQGRQGGLNRDAAFVIAGDLNADPDAGDSLGAIEQLLNHAHVQDPKPTSPGARQRWPAGNGRQTADWGLRADYVLPSRQWKRDQSAVLWPADNHLAEAVRTASDHRPVWADLTLNLA